MTKIKICGLKRPEDIEMMNIYKPDYCGFIIDYPKSHRSICPEKVKDLVKELDRRSVKAVGVFVDAPLKLAAGMLEEGVIDIAQLHGNENEEYISTLRKLTGKPVIKAFKVKDSSSIDQAAMSCADYILLDQGKGGGKTFDWSLMEESIALKKRDWFLAGGLSTENLKEVIEKFHPYAVDLSSSVETDKVKDERKVRQVFEIVRKCAGEFSPKT